MPSGPQNAKHFWPKNSCEYTHPIAMTSCKSTRQYLLFEFIQNFKCCSYLLMYLLLSQVTHTCIFYHHRLYLPVFLIITGNMHLYLLSSHGHIPIYILSSQCTYTYILYHLGDNCIQNFHLGRYIVGYTVGN